MVVKKIHLILLIISCISFNTLKTNVRYTVLHTSVTHSRLNWTVLLRWCHVPYTRRYDWRCTTHATTANSKKHQTVFNDLSTRCQAYMTWRRSYPTPTSYSLYYHIYYKGKVYLRYHDLQNYRPDFFKIHIFEKLMIRHWCQSPLFSLIPAQKNLLTKKPNAKNWHCCLYQKSWEVHKMLASLGLWWRQHMIVRGLN